MPTLPFSRTPSMHCSCSFPSPPPAENIYYQPLATIQPFKYASHYSLAWFIQLFKTLICCLEIHLFSSETVFDRLCYCLFISPGGICRSCCSNPFSCSVKATNCDAGCCSPLCFLWFRFMQGVYQPGNHALNAVAALQGWAEVNDNV